MHTGTFILLCVCTEGLIKDVFTFQLHHFLFFSARAKEVWGFFFSLSGAFKWVSSMFIICSVCCFPMQSRTQLLVDIGSPLFIYSVYSSREPIKKDFKYLLITSEKKNIGILWRQQLASISQTSHLIMSLEAFQQSLPIRLGMLELFI